MLHKLLMGCVFALLRVSPGQAQVPIQDNFDASQVGPGTTMPDPFPPPGG